MRSFGIEADTALEPGRLALGFMQVKAAKERHIVSKTYEDAHVNRWSPSSFAHQMRSLREMGLIQMDLVNVIPTAIGGAEFYVTLQKHI